MVLVNIQDGHIKDGVSIAEMQRELEVKDYKTMWVMAHKIRKAMQDRDERYRKDTGWTVLLKLMKDFLVRKGKTLVDVLPLGKSWS